MKRQQTLMFRVSGRVQGVFFRASAKQHADSLGIAGWVRNCGDGDVEGVASGTKEQLDNFGKWLAQGPAMARVQNLKLEACDYRPFDGFKVR
jgi:acylphosphatase